MSAEDLLSLNLPLFDGLAEDDLSGVTLEFQRKNLDAWQTLFNQTDDSNDVFFLLSGSLLAVYWTREGREIIFSRFPIGSYLGELAALDGEKRSLAVVARTRATVVAMPQPVFVALFDQVPVIRQRITRDLVGRIRKLTEKNLELTTYSVEQRVSSYLISLAIERGKLEKGVVLEDAPTHSEIAASVGANREMVSRTITRLGRKGIIRSARKRIELLDPDALSESL